MTLGAGTLSDSATVTGRVSPVAGATITFTLYAPGDTTCSATPVFTPAAVPYPVAGGSVSSPAYTPTAPGVYRWVAVYSGDANNSPVTEACNAADESTTVVPGSPTIATTASPGITLGAGTLSDSATVSGRVSPVAGATITFTLYGPGNTTCTGAPVFGPAVVPYPVAGGSVSSPTTTPPVPATYLWFAANSGDADNSPVTGACTAATETATVTSPPAPTPAPQIAVTKAASPASRVAPGGTFTFTITVSDPSTTTPVTITSLVDNIYGNLATRSGSTCGKLIGVTLAPGATSQPCSFPGSFTGKAGASQTDVVTVTGSYNGGTPVTATAHATVTLSPAPTQAVLPVGVHEPSGCISKPVKVYVTGSRIARVVFYLDGKRLGTVSKRDSLGRFLVTISPEHLTKGKIHHLTVVTEPVLHSGQPVHTLHRDLDVCGTPRLPLFTG
jgi:hypothetical protein